MPVAVQTLSLTLSGSASSSQGLAVIGPTPLVLGGYQSLTVAAIVGSNTGGTLNAYLQFTPDGVTWFDWLAYAQQAAGASSFAKSLTAVRPSAQTTLQTIGTGTSPALAAGTFTATDWGVGLRLLTVSGSGTTVGGTVSVYLLASQVAGAA